ncbi:MAG: proton-conducting membrane transporter [Lachnospiraceae bacterium]|nr:proton-conducting membrane transporter [Lachnospiraceae bacterium]
MLVRPIKDVMHRRIWCMTVVCAASVCVWTAALFVRRDPVTVYSFTRGFAVNFGLDGMANLFALMISVMWPLVLLYAFEYMKGDEARNRFFAFYIMTYGVTLGVCYSTDMITMYLFFEMLTLVTIPLVSHYGGHESMYAGRKYAAYTIGGASLGFMAVVLTTMFGDAGSFTYGGSIDGTYDVRIMLLAFVLGFIGFGAKAAVFPLHDWLPTASVAPTPVTALLHAVAVVNSGVFAVLRMTYYVFGADFLRGTIAQVICLALSIFSILFGAVQAIRERHFKRRLAYSTMSNLSYMMLGAMTMSPLGLKAGLAHMVFHGIIKICLFMCAGAFMHQARKTYIYEINGVGRRMPATFTAYTLCALSLTGIPLFCGFVSKWQLLQAALTAAGQASQAVVPDSRLSQILPYLLYAGTAALIIAAFLCAMYTLSISVRAFFPMDTKDLYTDNKVKEAGPLMRIPIWVFAIINLVLGVCPGPILAVLTAIGEGRL